MRSVCVLATSVVISLAASATSKPHTVALGRPMPVKLLIGPSEAKTLEISVRALYVDGKVKDFTTGESHDVTDHEFVVRRAYRVNDSLPDDSRKSPKWLWQRGDWMMVDRKSGKASSLKLPDFDPFYSQVSWYRDYAAYCGISSSGDRVIAVVGEIGNKKPLYRKDLGKNTMGEDPDSNCSAPHWERQPARVTFLPKTSEKLTVTVSGRFVDRTNETDADEQ